MKKLNRIMLWMAIMPFFFVVSCKDNDPTPVDAFSIMTDYMVENDMDLPAVIASGWVIPRPATVEEVPDFLASRYVMDLRSADDFAKGHIEGAVNTTLGTLLADATNSGSKQILIVCYTGQTAAHATVALRLSGYKNAQLLKWGMSGWTGEAGYDKWTSNTSSSAVGNANWTMDATADLQTYDFPTINSTSTDGATILADQVDAMLASGFKGVAASDVYGTPSNYHINNFWDEASVTTYGHIAGAYRISPLSLAGGEFKYYDPQATNVTYCWTGQTSSMVTAYLTVLGYEAKSLKFGANAMIYDNLAATSPKWHAPDSNYPVVGQ